MQCFIQTSPADQTMVYAGWELKKYLDQMSGDFSVGLCTGKFPKGQPKLLLAVNPERFSVEDTKLDDAYEIEVQGGVGTIYGSNSRAVLLGVYRLLTEAGCRFLRPRADGEVIPSLPLKSLYVSVKDSASFRHRGIVIEGATSLEHILDILEWMPKVGYNSFFTQFTDLRCFYERYYLHEHNPLFAPETMDEETYLLFDKTVNEAIAKRGLLHHAMGHGWTCEPLGIAGHDWNPVELKLPEETQTLLAQIDGKRGLFRNIPAITNLCYSNPVARKKIVEYAVSYAKNHPEVDYLNFWLADATHSFCECDDCAKKLPSDWYIVLLNELDEALCTAGLATKLVFLLYIDLLFPPQLEQLKNKERFILMFAPISRPFSHSFADFEVPAGEPVPYVLNTTPIPESIEDNLQCLQAWQKKFEGDGFDFDYYMGRAHYGDPGYCEISKIISRDLQYLPKLKLNGILSCQELRTFFPTALPSYTLGKMLWNNKLTYEEIAQEYFSAAFGEEYAVARDYLETASACFTIDYWFRGMRHEDTALAQKAAKAVTLAEKTKDIFLSLKRPVSPCQKLSWQYLELHTEYLIFYANTIRCRAEGKAEEAVVWWKKLADFLHLNESSLLPVMDVYRILEIASWYGLPAEEAEIALE